MKFKRAVFVGDPHCGHRVGLTPPKYQSAIVGEEYYKIQIEVWNFYSEVIDSLKPIDIFVCNGDAVDGPGTRSGGTELITQDPNKQNNIAVEALSYAEAGKIFMTYGTPYHSGQTQDQEYIIAKELGAFIKSHLWLDINGVVFDIKHHIGNSSIPHGKATPISKEWLWNQLWAIHEEQPKADVYLRSHVHNHSGAFGVDWLGMTLPPLQGQGSKFGARQCSQEVHLGLVWFDVYEDGSYIWDKRILRAESQKQKAIKL